MKKKPIYEKLVSRSTSVGGGESHEFFAEQLESRILYSAAPAPTPDASVALEATETQADARFESIDGFKDAANHRSQISEGGSIETILMLSSFDEMGLDEPVRFDSNPVAFRQWDSSFEVSETSNVEPVDLSDVEIVSISSYFGNQGRYEFDLDQGDETHFSITEFPTGRRIVALEESFKVFGAEEITPPLRVFGMSHIERSIEELVEFVA